MVDPFQNVSSTFDGPARNAHSITPDDNTDLPNVSRGLWVGVEGDVTVMMYSGVTETFVGVRALLPIAVKRVLATGTTAGAIVALW